MSERTWIQRNAEQVRGESWWQGEQRLRSCRPWTWMSRQWLRRGRREQGGSLWKGAKSSPPH